MYTSQEALCATLLAMLPSTRPKPCMRRLPTTIIRASSRSASRMRASAGLPRADEYVTASPAIARLVAMSRATFSASPASETIHLSLPLPYTSVRSVSKADTTCSVAPNATARSRAVSAALRAVPLVSTPTTMIPLMVPLLCFACFAASDPSLPCPEFIYGFLQHRGEPPDTLGDGVGRHGAEREPQLVGRLIRVAERRTRDEDDPGIDRLVQQGVGVHALGKGDPHEEAALGPCPRQAFRHVRLQRRQHGVAPFRVQAAVGLDLALPVVVTEVGRDQHLVEGGRAQGHGLRREVVPALQVCGHQSPADAKPRR